MADTDNDVLAAVLRKHWLVTVGCDHEAKTDTPQCACSLVAFPTFNSVGEAVSAWVDHVVQEFGSAIKATE